MKNYDNKRKVKLWKNEQKAGGFRCSHCSRWVIINEYMGTANRNHCNVCLWSKHVDENKGDRRALCQAGMMPIGLTFKHEGYSRQGELMLVHYCLSCNKISINRIAGDDFTDEIIDVFEMSKKVSDEIITQLKPNGICLLVESDRHELYVQLFGRQS